MQDHVAPLEHTKAARKQTGAAPFREVCAREEGVRRPISGPERLCTIAFQRGVIGTRREQACTWPALSKAVTVPNSSNRFQWASPRGHWRGPSSRKAKKATEHLSHQCVLPNYLRSDRLRKHADRCGSHRALKRYDSQPACGLYSKSVRMELCRRVPSNVPRRRHTRIQWPGLAGLPK